MAAITNGTSKFIPDGFNNQAVVNLVDKFDPKIREVLAQKTYTEGMFNSQINFTGVNEVTVANVGAANIQSYNTATNFFTGSRFGVPTPLSNYTQSFVMDQLDSFTFYVDALQNQDALNMFDINKALKRTLAQEEGPVMDKYRLKQWCADAGTVVKATAEKTLTTGASVTAETVAQNILYWLRQCRLILQRRLINTEQLTVRMRDDLFDCLFEHPSFKFTDKLAQDSMVKAVIHEMAGFRIVPVPDEYFPAGVAWVMSAPEGLIAATKVKTYRVHHNPPGLNGDLAEGLIRHGAWILDVRADCCCVMLDVGAEGYLDYTLAKGTNNKSFKITLGAAPVSAHEVHGYFTLDNTDPRCSPTREEFTVPANTTQTTITASASGMQKDGLTKGTNTVKVVVVDEDNAFRYAKHELRIA